jgi:hypothetical protein
MMNLQVLGTPLKAKLDNEGTADFGDEPKSTVVSELHPENALFPILVTDGIDMEAREVQSTKEYPATLVADGKFTDSSEVQLKKISSSMLVTEGRFTVVSE